MKITDKLKEVVEKANGTIFVLENIIKGFSPPCCACAMAVQCENKGRCAGICVDFVLCDTSEDK